MCKFCWDCYKKLGLNPKDNNFANREGVQECAGCGWVAVDKKGKRVVGSSG